jgi:hypothetical protein
MALIQSKHEDLVMMGQVNIDQTRPQAINQQPLFFPSELIEPLARKLLGNIRIPLGL